VLDEVWLRNQALFRSLVRKMLFEAQTVEDVLHDAFLHVLETRREFASEREAFNYLRKTVINTTIDRYRRLRRHYVINTDGEPLPHTIDDGEDPLTTMIREEAEVKQSETLRRLEQLVQELTPEQQAAIDLFFAQDTRRRLKTICQESGIPYSTLRGRLSSAINQLRSKLEIAAPRRRGLKKAGQA
jgi:RNA polymerase sigma factor (sigma-70 family)